MPMIQPITKEMEAIAMDLLKGEAKNATLETIVKTPRGFVAVYAPGNPECYPPNARRVLGVTHDGKRFRHAFDVIA